MSKNRNKAHFTPIPEPIEIDRHGDKIYEHESFGLVRAHRYSGGPRRPMFGSKILHSASGIVELEISQAQYKRGLNNDWYYPKKSVVSIEMTEAQWAALVSGLNAQPVPCTINERWVDGKYISMEEPPFFGIEEQFTDEMRERIEKIEESTREVLKTIDDMLADKTVSKRKLQDLRLNLAATLGNLPSSLEFFNDQFEEQMVNTVEEAKLTIETHLQRMLMCLGVEAAGEKLIELPGASKKEIED